MINGLVFLVNGHGGLIVMYIVCWVVYVFFYVYFIVVFFVDRESEV